MKTLSGLIRTTALFSLLFTSMAVIISPARAAGVCYVNDDAAGENTGGSWADAYTSLQSALADNSCTEIWVAAGTYIPHALDRSISFALESGTAIYGGFAGTETLLTQRNPKTNVTILSGDLNGDDSSFANNGENSYHVVYADGADNTAVLDGFTIRGGNANGSSPEERGGGIYANNTAATLANLIFHNNTAGGYGGGMYAGPSTSSTLTNVTFKDNSSASAGGGLYMTIATVSLLGVTFSNNTAYAGGGIAIANQLPTLTNVTFSGNSATLGGGLYLYDTDPTLTNVTISGNSASVAGGGLYVEYTSVPKLTNVIIANSTSGGDCVVNSGSIDGSSSNNLIEDTVDDCGLTDGVNGNIVGTDPELGALADNGGPTQTHSIGLNTPARNAGTNTGCPATDQRGTVRPQDSTCDIGAFEALVVANNNDSGAGSLRQAITDAPDGSTITFAANYTITLGSSLPQIGKNITIIGNGAANTIIQANAAPNIASYRVFLVTSTGNLTLDGLSVKNGVCTGGCNVSGTVGGGIFNNGGLLTVKNSSISDNSAIIGGGIETINGLVTVTNSTISANSVTSSGGGVDINGGSLTVNNSTFSGNAAGYGGGIATFNAPTTTVTNSTFSGNSATNGGGINNYDGALTAANSTFSGNSATNSGGAIYSNTGAVTLTNSTVSGNAASAGGGVFSFGTLNLKNTILANSSSGADCSINGGSFSASNSIVETNGTASNTCSISNGANGNIVGVDPQLGSLANNGGSTQTLALLAGSIAINGGDDSICNAAPVSGLDQRGTARPNGAQCDIGSYEHEDAGAPSVTGFSIPSSATSLGVSITTFSGSDDGILTGYLITESATPPATGAPGWTSSAPTSFTVAGTGSRTLYPWVKDGAGNVSGVYGSPASVSVCIASPTVTSTSNSGAGTLRQAIMDACAGGVINFSSSLSGSTVYLASTLTLNKNVTIDGSSLASPITLSGDSDQDIDGDVRVFNVGTGVTATLDSLTITQGSASEAGAIFNEGTLTIANSTIAYNTSTGYSGAISNNAGSLTITDSTFYSNTATGSNQGAGAILNNSNLTISGSTFISNTATVGSSSGGAIYNTDPDTVISNSTFSGNAAGANGGAIYTTTSMAIKNSTLSGNSATNAGGLYIDGGTTSLENTIIANSTGGDCTNTTIGLGTNINNLIEDNSCYAFLSGDPMLGSLAGNGGPTQTFALLAGSPAINAGDNTTCAAAPISNLDQRGLTRSGNGPNCDIGAYEYQDSTAPTVLSSVRANSNPASTANASVNFTVTFSESVSGVDATDFSLSTSGVTGASITGVTGSGSSRTVSVNTGSGSGNIRLIVLDDNSILDVVGTPLNAGFAGGQSYIIDKPSVVSINRTNPNTTAKSIINFTVIFSESVSGVDMTDFSLTTTGTVSGTSISATTGSGTTYIVSVKVGSGNGTVRLNLVDNDTIKDVSSFALGGTGAGNGSFTTGQTYSMMTFVSIAAQDGWVLESSQTSNLGGSLSNNGTLNVGDHASNGQYRSILSFNTAGIPDTAVLTGATLKVKQLGLFGLSNPVTTYFQGFMIDIKTGFLGASNLELSDFQAASSKTLGPAFDQLVSGWYDLNLSGGKTYIYKLNLTQLRLRFKMPDDNNGLSNYVSLHSGNTTNAADRPLLVVTYYLP